MLFGLASPVAKPLLGSIGPLQLAGLFYLGAAIGVAPLLVKTKGNKNAGADAGNLTPSNIKRLAIALMSGGIAAPVCLLFGLKAASASSVSMWLSLEAIFTSLLASLLFREHLGRLGWIAVMGATFAAILLSVGEGVSGIAAGSFVAAACFFWALDNNVTALIDGISPARITLLKGIVAGTINFCVGFLIQPQTISISLIAAGLLVGAICYGLSLTLYIMAAQGMGAARSQILFATSPFWGVVFSGLILHETLSLVQLSAGIVLAGALTALLRDAHSHDHSHEHMAHTHMHRHDDGHHNHTHEGQPASLTHTHWHEHEPMSHAHPHWPDLHHRHDH